MRIARVFPRITKATPRDRLAFTREPGLFTPRDIDEIHISVAFTWDLDYAMQLAQQWEGVAPVIRVGGPGTGEPGGDFTPGQYLKKGYVITSRGCPNHCWFCSVPQRDGQVRELPITEGWIVQDDNLLACSERHILAVIDMLSRQKHKAQFTGGLEAARLTRPIAEALRSIKPASVYFAYDTPEEWEALTGAVQLLRAVGFPERSHCICCYVLIGFPKDTMAEAELRLRRVASLGVMPFAMLWRDKWGQVNPGGWRKLQKQWARPVIMGVEMHGTQD